MTNDTILVAGVVEVLDSPSFLRYHIVWDIL